VPSGQQQQQQQQQQQDLGPIGASRILPIGATASSGNVQQQNINMFPQQMMGMHDDMAMPQSVGSASAEATIARLSRENQALWQQLSRWHKIGTSIAQKDARIAQALSQVIGYRRSTRGESGANQVDLLEAFTTGSAGQKTRMGSTLNAQQSIEDAANTAPNYLFIFAEVSMIVLSASLAYMCRDRLMPLLAGTVECKSSSPSPPSRLSMLLGPLGRRMGMTEYAIEVGEVHIGNIDDLPLMGSIKVRIQPGSRTYVETEGVLPCESAFVPFKEAFHLGASRFDVPWIISVYDVASNMSDRIAFLELPSQQVVAAAVNRREFFKYELHEEGPRWESRVQEAAGKKPYLAMRLRDISSRDKLAAVTGFRRPLMESKEKQSKYQALFNLA